VTAPPTAGLPADPRASWRREVGELRAGEQRRRHPLGVHVGEPGGQRESVELPWPEPRWHDTGVRVDVVTALLGRTDPTVAATHGWITRPGVPELHDADLAWYAAAVRGCAVLGVALTGFHAVTRTGWVDVVTGERRAWKRLRLGPGARGHRQPGRPGSRSTAGVPD
jgi:hypothetical protein